jgi:D-threo-aldose 1-dehydrogenase
MQFPFAHPCVVQVLTGAMRPAEIEENARLMTHPIPAQLWDDLRDAGLLDERAPVPGEPALAEGGN